MVLSAGRRLGPYEVLAQIGVGGMGEVYRAKDTRLQREVALKVLPDLFAHDSDRLTRFQREAQVLASLNHPNIAIIHGLEEADGVRALVLELVEGPTLADRIAHGPIPVDEALPIARQTAEALEAAHEHGITHRDLKPLNIKLRSDGTVKVLDFGLAKLAQASDLELHASDLSLSPTLTTPAATRMGVILGTAAYMSPEQAKGKAVDRQTDIWAFGCVLYEMLTGKRAFGGEDVSDTLAAVLKSEPDWRALPAETPGPIRKLLRRCVEKDRKRRLANIADARLDIEEAQTMPAGDVVAGPPAPLARTSGRIIGLAMAAALGIGGIGVGAGVWLADRPAPPRVTRTMITPSAAAPLTITGTSRDLAIAPDGTRLVYVGANGTRLVVRALDQLQPTALHERWLPQSSGLLTRWAVDRLLRRQHGLQESGDVRRTRGGLEPVVRLASRRELEPE